MDVVVEDDDPDHHSQAERNRLLAGEAAAVLPEGAQGCVSDQRRELTEAASERYSRRFQHDFTDCRHGAEAVGRVLDGQVLVLGQRPTTMKGRDQTKSAALAATSLTSDTNFVVPSLNVFSMGVASA